MRAGLEWSDPLITRDGRLSLDRLRSRDPAYALACTQGVKCKVLRHTVSKRNPSVAAILLEARNTGKKVERGENEVQIMLRIYNRALECYDKRIALDWVSIARVVMRGFPML